MLFIIPSLWIFHTESRGQQLHRCDITNEHIYRTFSLNGEWEKKKPIIQSLWRKIKSYDWIKRAARTRTFQSKRINLFDVTSDWLSVRFVALIVHLPSHFFGTSFGRSFNFGSLTNAYSSHIKWFSIKWQMTFLFKRTLQFSKV